MLILTVCNVSFGNLTCNLTCNLTYSELILQTWRRYEENRN
jgi:hypothetical protein